jgi:hypothetical protein
LSAFNKFQGPGKFSVPFLKVLNPPGEQIRRGVLPPVVKFVGQLRQFPGVAPVMLCHILQKGLCFCVIGGIPGLVVVFMVVMMVIPLSFRHINSF